VFFFVLCVLCRQFLCVFLRLVCPMSPVSLCFSSSCVSYVASFSVFFFVLCVLCRQFLCIVHIWLPPWLFSNVYFLISYIIPHSKIHPLVFCVVFVDHLFLYFRFFFWNTYVSVHIMVFNTYCVVFVFVFYTLCCRFSGLSIFDYQFGIFSNVYF
jgi:hypothetical protein